MARRGLARRTARAGVRDAPVTRARFDDVAKEPSRGRATRALGRRRNRLQICIEFICKRPKRCDDVVAKPPRVLGRPVH
jgi:hypothetical protein